MNQPTPTPTPVPMPTPVLAPTTVPMPTPTTTPKSPTIHTLLIANRGEIARRIIRTAKLMGIGTVAVYSDPDRRAPHVREADVAVAIGGSTASESYLRGKSIIAAAKRSGANAIHPGYGFLSENADFAQTVVDAGLIFVGPTPEHQTRRILRLTPVLHGDRRRALVFP